MWFCAALNDAGERRHAAYGRRHALHDRLSGLEPLRVLVVDDQPDVVELLTMLLEQWGHRCRIAFSASEALLVAAEFDPEVVLLDLGLPDLSGYDVARDLRSRVHPDVVIAAITGWGREGDRVRAFAAGFDRHITKPATRAAILDVLATASFRRDERSR